MTRTIRIDGFPTTFQVLDTPYDPARTGGWVEMVRAGESRRIYLDLGRLPLTQERFDRMDEELLASWWEGAAA